MDDDAFLENHRNQTALYVDLEIDEQAIPRLHHIKGGWDKMVVPVDENMTVEKLSEKHERMKKDWEASNHHRTLVELFENTVLKQESLNITTCMCLGLGSMNSADQRHRDQVGCDRSMEQLICFESWISLLGEPLRRKHIRRLILTCWQRTGIRFRMSISKSLSSTVLMRNSYAQKATRFCTPQSLIPISTGTRCCFHRGLHKMLCGLRS